MIVKSLKAEMNRIFESLLHDKNYSFNDVRTEIGMLTRGNVAERTVACIQCYRYYSTDEEFWYWGAGDTKVAAHNKCLPIWLARVQKDVDSITAENG